MIYPVGGALKLEVSTATPMITAGDEFSIYVIIRNPFPVPVIIHSTETHIPVELSDQIWKKTTLEKIKLEQSKKLENLKGFKRFREKTNMFFNSLFKNNKLKSPRVAIAVGTEITEPHSKENIIQISGNENQVYMNNWQLNFANLTAEEIEKRLWQINNFIQGKQPITLRLGDAVVRHFILKTNKVLMFKPISHTFQIQVNYEVDELNHIDTIPYSLNIRAAASSSMTGAIIGSVLGTLVNSSVNFNDLYSLSKTFLTGIIFAFILVVAFARKNNVQQIVSIEDFWGGLFIGFMVGYSGETFVKSVLLKN